MKQRYSSSTRVQARPPGALQCLLAATSCWLAACGQPPSNGDAATDAPTVAESGGPVVDAGPTTTMTFQQGVDGYTGCRSVGISTYSGLGAAGEWNGNGATFADGMNDWCTGTSIPPNSYDEVWLLRFDLGAVPAGSTVVEATLAVYAYGNEQSSNLFLAGSYLAVDWNTDTPETCAGCSSAAVGWRYRNGNSAPWTGLGASGAGTDLVANAAFRLPESGGFALGSMPREYTARLDPARVQRWLSGSNFGVRLVGGVAGVHHGYVQPGRAQGADRPASMRPRLTLRLAR